MDLSFQGLSKKWDENKNTYSDYFQLRLRRAFSWWKASINTNSHDEKFIFLWISFNSIYSCTESDNVELLKKKNIFKSYERTQLEDFFKKIAIVDNEKKINEFFLKNFTNMMRVFIHNRWVFNQYWEFINGNISEFEWKKEFDKQNRIAARSIVEGNICLFCNILFGRLYILRNQLMHGAATYEGSKNRDQVIDGAKILNSLIPMLIFIMLENHQMDWGKPYYRPSD